MTAEIAILNKTAVALAADSAVTIGAGGRKVFNTVNKLFTLSKYEPVGMMIYGNAAFAGVPWETIIKMYRRDLGTRSFDKLGEYAEHFINYLHENSLLFPPDAQQQQYQFVATDYFRRVANDIAERVKAFVNIPENPALDEAGLMPMIDAVIEDHDKAWIGFELGEGCTEEEIVRIADAYESAANRAITTVFEKLPLDDSRRSRLRGIAANLFCRTRYPASTSGIVVAGFGTRDLYPGLVELQMRNVILNRARFGRLRVHDVTSEGAGIIPFAQRDMVYTFMTGVNPEYKTVVETYLQTLFAGLADQILPEVVPHLAQPGDDAVVALRDLLVRMGETCVKDLKYVVGNYSRTSHSDPVLDAVSTLPKNELAEMAESLVNLTAFKQKVSIEVETVGGPIDVAVISKGDGFVWIKRKHYFKPELNRSFFDNYFREEPP